MEEALDGSDLLGINPNEPIQHNSSDASSSSSSLSSQSPSTDIMAFDLPTVPSREATSFYCIPAKSLKPLSRTTRKRIIHKYTAIALLVSGCVWFALSIPLKVVWSSIFYLASAILGIFAYNRLLLTAEIVFGKLMLKLKKI